MKKLLAILLSFVLLLPLSALGEASASPKTIILMTYFCQSGWNEGFSLGAVDDEGNCWTLALDSWQDVPLGETELLTWVQQTGELKKLGTLTASALFDIKGMVLAVQGQNIVQTPGTACDAGTQSSYACRPAKDGSTELILLGRSGDDGCENTDPTAQALYRFLRDRFPSVKDYDGDALIAPAGFQPVSLPVFCGYEDLPLDPSALTLKAYRDDCEAGRMDLEPLLNAQALLSMTVTGKANCNVVTGGTTNYVLTYADGQSVASFSFYNGLLVMDDGMYHVN